MFLRHQHRGSSGQLANRMKEFGLPQDALLSKYELLVELDWLRPTFHVPIKREWFEAWENFPQYPVSPASHCSGWEWYFDVQSSIAENDFASTEWFLHPYFQNTSEGAQFISHAVKSPTSVDLTAFDHPRGFKVVPAFDYFFEWQLFRLADIVSSARGKSWHPWLPGSYDDLVEYANSVTPETFNRPASLTRWEKRGEAFGWLAHYIAFENAFDRYEFSKTRSAEFQANANKNQILDDLYAKRREGASALVAWLQIDSTILETALKEEFLTLAQNWRWQKWDKTDQYVRLWRALQAQIQSAVDWLCLLTEKSRVDYLNQFRYAHLGQDVWAQLGDVLPYSQWKFARTLSSYIAEIGKRFPTTKFGSLGEFSMTPKELVSIGGKVDAFDDYVTSIGRFVDENTYYGNEEDPFRVRGRGYWYRLIGVLSEVVLLATVEQLPNYEHVRTHTVAGKKLQLQGVVAEYLGNQGVAFDSQRLTEGYQERELTQLTEKIRRAQNKEELILYFCLAANAARNGQAHGRTRDFGWLDSDWAAPILDSLVYFVPWATAQLLNLVPKTSGVPSSQTRITN
jgi:hypothetical protein